MARPRKKDRHLPPCVYEHHGAFWYVKRGKWTRLGDDLPDALQAYAMIVSQPEGGVPQLIDRVLAHIKPTIADSTYRQYQDAARHLKTRLVEFRPDQVKPKHVAAIKLDMADTPNMANRTLSLLRLTFSYAVEWQLVDSNPCIGVKRHKEAKRGRYITDSEYTKIRLAAGDRLQVIMDLLYLTGQRVSDVLKIRYADLTEDGIEFQPQKTRNSTGTKICVGWTSELKEVVERANSLRGNVRALTLLHNRRGKAPDYSTVKIQWNKACAKAGVEDAQMRDLRAKSLTDAKRQGHDATALAGHVSPAMTARYIRRRETPVVSGPVFATAKKSI